MLYYQYVLRVPLTTHPWRPKSVTGTSMPNAKRLRESRGEGFRALGYFRVREQFLIHSMSRRRHVPGQVNSLSFTQNPKSLFLKRHSKNPKPVLVSRSAGFVRCAVLRSLTNGTHTHIYIHTHTRTDIHIDRQIER